MSYGDCRMAIRAPTVCVETVMHNIKFPTMALFFNGDSHILNADDNTPLNEQLIPMNQCSGSCRHSLFVHSMTYSKSLATSTNNGQAIP